ncbi:DUF2922 domain-containing protein [Peptostreptococcus canis]|uniref:DUF2922 domain-containing protein n=1 Tax=Peptostreptococcus canis TaxID=1159213 RepID=A0ABR6TL34_9FIRM|nr:DUF2922 domain-containing protein [Peptostreptococcus canis]MBC2576124.1 DUF2922 domain-containing protein [Peptostreptococcus canis]MBP1998343.1 hypothetical protein [Peptostreptococcus canis]
MSNKILLMRFKKSDGKVYSVRVRNPKENVSEEEIKEVMEYILDNKAIKPDGLELAETIDARIVSTDTQEFDLVII